VSPPVGDQMTANSAKPNQEGYGAHDSADLV